MRIMSFNILCFGNEELNHNWERRIPLVVRTIRNADPDSFGVQEATPEWMTALKACFPEYECIGVGRDDGANKGEYSAVFYKTEKYTSSENGTFWLSETPDKPGKGWDAVCPRICSYAVLEDKATGKKFVHFNTHLDHKGAVAMQKGAELVVKKANELYPDLTAFFTGDFNVTPDSAPCKAVKDGGFTDCRDIAETTDKGITFHAFLTREEYEGTVIDYVFKKGDVKVKNFTVIRDTIDGEMPSDHYPVYADIEF